MPKEIDFSEQGFTFLELMAVLALVGLLYFFALPSLKTSYYDKKTPFAAWLVMNAQNFKTAAKAGASEYYLYLDLDSEAVWTGSGTGAKFSGARRVDQETNILGAEFISGLRVDSGVLRIGFFKGGYSDGVIIYTNEGGENFSYRMDPFLNEIRIMNGHVSWEE